MLRRATALLTLAGCLALPTLAHASGADVIHDCERNGAVTGHYTLAELRSALANLPADDKEYTNCQESIQQAEAAAAVHKKTSGAGNGSGAGSGTTGGTSGGSGTGTGGTSATTHTAPTPNAGSHATGSGPLAHAAHRSPNASDTAALAAAQRGLSRGTVAVGGALVQPGTAVSDRSGGLGSLPTPLIVVLALLCAGALASLFVAARRTTLVGRVLARDRT